MPCPERVRKERGIQLRTLARADGEVTLEVAGQATQRSLLDSLEASYPTLRDTLRDYVTQQRRPDAPLPDEVVSGVEPFLVVGAIAGG